MRTLTSTLEAAQKAVTVKTLVKVVLTLGANSYTYTKTRILDIDETENGNLQSCKITLDNSDGELTDLDLRGYKGVLSLGAIASGEEYSPCAPMWVIPQQFESTADKLICTLSLVGICNLMSEDKASASYIPDDTDTKTVKTLINEILGASLACFSLHKAYEVVWKPGYDTLADTYKPKDSFRIYEGNNRLSAVNRLLDYTKNVMRAEDDGKIHIFKPTTTDTTYDYEYSLETGHHFFAKALRNRVVIPNYIKVHSREDDDPQRSGTAQDDSFDSLPTELKKREYYQMRLETDEQAQDIAKAKLSKAQLWCEAGSASVPMNVGQEAYDYIKVTDSREGDYRVGNIGTLRRHYTATKNEWRTSFVFGNWQTVRKALADLGVTSDDIENYFSRLSVGDLYVEHVHAYLDEIIDGPDVYVRQRSLQLDATGVYLTDDVLYTIRLPGGPQHNLHKSATAPSSPEDGDFWLDTNYEPNLVKMWDGDSWDELTAAEVAEFNRGMIFRELKSVALTADGLVVLDQVQEGTYGLVYYTDIGAGHILLSKTTKDGLWYDETGVAMNASTGIGLYGGAGINAFRTYPTKADYLAGTNVLCYIGTDGRLCINGPGSLRFYYGALYAGCLGVSDTSPYEFCILAMGGNPLLLATDAASGADIWLDPDSNYVLPYADNVVRLGNVSKQFYGGYYKSRLKIPVGTDLYD